jgi:hypothetical protein
VTSDPKIEIVAALQTATNARLLQSGDEKGERTTAQDRPPPGAPAHRFEGSSTAPIRVML